VDTTSRKEDSSLKKLRIIAIQAIVVFAASFIVAVALAWAALQISQTNLTLIDLGLEIVPWNNSIASAK
jgi:hypothetical protein